MEVMDDGMYYDSDEFSLSDYGEDSPSASQSDTSLETRPTTADVSVSPSGGSATDCLSNTSQSALALPEPEPKTAEEIEWEENIREKPEFNELLQAGIGDCVIFEIFRLIERGVLEFSDIDETVREAVKLFTKIQGVQFFKMLATKDMSRIARKAAYITAQTKVFWYCISNHMTIFNGPDPAKIEQLQKETGYPIVVSEGQRRYGPPPDWNGPAPDHREISISKIPLNWFEDMLVPLLSKHGKIYELRIMVDSVTGLTRHICFVKYCTDKETAAAVHKLNKYKADDKTTLYACYSSGNKKLFIGNIPKTLSEDEIQSMFGLHIHGLKNVEIFISEELAAKGLKNRGFCFLEFQSHSYAAEAKRIFPRLAKQLFGDDRVLRVEWAEKQYQMPRKEKSKVKCLHVGNVASSVTENMLKEKFESYGKIEEIKKVRDYAFIHFAHRGNCLKAIKEANGSTLGDLKITCRVSTSGPMIRKIRKKREKAKLRGDFPQYNTRKLRQAGRSNRHSYDDGYYGNEWMSYHGQDFGRGWYGGDGYYGNQGWERQNFSYGSYNLGYGNQGWGNQSGLGAYLVQRKRKSKKTKQGKSGSIKKKRH